MWWWCLLLVLTTIVPERGVEGFASVSVTRRSDVRVHAQKSKKKRLNELRKIGGAGVEATSAWADKLVDRLDAAVYPDVEKDLLEECFSTERDIEKIDSLISQFGSPSNVIERGSYRLVWAKSDEGIGEIGTGLHRVPLARMEELYLTLEKKKSITITEVVRVIGPFPNIKNRLLGSFSVGSEPLLLRVNYDVGYDGTGKEIRGKKVEFKLVHASPEMLVLAADPGSGQKNDWLVFEPEPDLADALKRLRVPPNEDNDDKKSK